MTTTRERRLARAERLRGWAESRDRKAAAAEAAARDTFDRIPFGQPILVGHHSERADRNRRDRAASQMRRSFEDAAKAESMRSRADNIEAAAEHAIYSDDDDAIERLAERIAGWEAERARIKAYNASCRKGAPDPSLLDESQRRALDSVLRYAPYQSKGGAFPAYHLSNIGGRISKARQRLAALQRAAGVETPG